MLNDGGLFILFSHNKKLAVYDCPSAFKVINNTKLQSTTSCEGDYTHTQTLKDMNTHTNIHLISNITFYITEDKKRLKA